MSGGHWGYKRYAIQEMAANLAPMLEAVAESEHIVDWAICADTSRADAERKLFELWERTFDQVYGDGDNPEVAAEPAPSGPTWRQGVRPEVADAIENLLRATEHLSAPDWPPHLQHTVAAINRLATVYLIRADADQLP